MRQFVLKKKTTTKKKSYSVFESHVMRKEGRYDKRRVTFYNAVAVSFVAYLLSSHSRKTGLKWESKILQPALSSL